MNYEAELTDKNIEIARKNRIKWRKQEGLDVETGICYIYFPEDAYDIREELKQAGFRFTRILKWHSTTIPAGYEDKVFEFHSNPWCEYYVWGGAWREGVQEVVNDKINRCRPQVECNSKWVGEVGDSISHILVSLVSARTIDSAYGEENVYTFEDKEGNRYSWITKSFCPSEKGEQIFLSGRVKSHNEYKGVKSTRLTYCKIEKEN